MLKFVFFFFLCISILNANELFLKIENFIGKKQFLVHNNLINLLFKNKEDFYNSSDKLNYILLLQTLKKNGLLDLKFKKPQELNIEFHTNKDAIKSLKILNETLRAMGYYYYFTKEVNYKSPNQDLVWIIRFKAEYALDPLLLIKELKLKSCKIIDIQKQNNTSWLYQLDTTNANITEAIKIDNNEKVILQKPLKAYFLQVDKAKTLQIIGRRLNHWFPYIVFYDKHLSILKVIKKNRIYKGYKTKIPTGTKYIKITDLYTLINIKRGLSIIVR